MASNLLTENFIQWIRKLWRKKFIKLISISFLSLETIVLGLFLFNGLFAGFELFFVFHKQVWRVLLKTSTFRGMLIIAMPLLLTAVGAAFNERAGVINIGLQGIMIFGAFAAAYFIDLTGDPWMGVLGAIFFGILISLVHAVLTITFKAEQIVTGVAINLLGIGITGLLTELIWRPGKSDPFNKFDNVNLFELPLIGPVIEFMQISKYGITFIPDPIVALNNHSPLLYIGLLLIPFCHILLFHTTIGLRIRVIGEHPQAAATAGVPVQRYQYFAVVFSGILSALGGAILAIDAGTFDTNMVGGKGFLALAAMIFGKWTVIGAAGASVFFGYFFVLSIKLPIEGVVNFKIPPQFLQMIPNVVAILALAGLIGRAIPPKAIGKPYDPTDS